MEGLLGLLSRSIILHIKMFTHKYAVENVAFINIFINNIAKTLSSISSSYNHKSFIGLLIIFLGWFDISHVGER